jgi:hypothetical protein
MHAAFLTLLLAAPLQNHPASGADPARCRVVLEDMGKVGLRISDAQAVASDVLSALRAKLGEEGVIFEGTLSGQLEMRRILGAGAEAQIQESQIEYLKAALAAAPFRVQVRFGTTKKRHWITLSCRNKDGKAPLEEQRFEGASFGAAREQMNAALPGFCPLALPLAASAEEAPKKPKREWTLPPRRE